MMNDNLPAPVAPGTIMKQGATGQEMELRGDMSSSATMAAQARARVEASMLLAKRFPRDFDDVRIKLLAECNRAGFAEVARYRVPNRGEGFTIRFAEAAARAMGNLDCGDSQILWDDPFHRVIRQSVVDLESNVAHSRTIVLEKAVERKNPEGRQILGTRQNSRGDETFLVRATEDEMLVKQFAYESRAKRNCILAHIPGDLLDECETKIDETKHARAKADPDGERKRVADAFAKLGVRPSDLVTLLGHRLDSTTPAELVSLREVHNALKGGEMTWPEVLKQSGVDESGSPGLKGLTERMKQANGNGDPKPPADDAVSDEARWKLLEERALLLVEDAEAQRDLHRELKKKFAEGGIEAAQTWLDQHPVFGRSKAAHSRKGTRKPLEE